MKEQSRVLTADDFGISEQPTLGDEEEKAVVLAEVDAMMKPVARSTISSMIRAS